MRSGDGACRVAGGVRLAGVTLAGVSALVGGTALAGPALAHDVLLRSVPAEGEHLTAAPDRVELVFDEPVSQRFASVVVAGPDGRTWSTGAATTAGSTVVQPLAARAPVGRYRVAYRVVSADGHPVTGTRSFVLDGAPPPADPPVAPPVVAPPTDASGAPAAAPPAAAPPGAVAAQRAHNGNRSAGTVPALLAAAGLTVAGLGAAWRVHRTRRGTAAGEAAR